jgi:hypothetical protein
MLVPHTCIFVIDHTEQGRVCIYGKKYRLQDPEMDARLSSWLPGIDVAGAQDDFSWFYRLALLSLSAMLSHVGVMWMG